MESHKDISYYINSLVCLCVCDMTVLNFFSYAESDFGHLDDNFAFSFLGRTGLFLIGCLIQMINCRRVHPCAKS